MKSSLLILLTFIFIVGCGIQDKPKELNEVQLNAEKEAVKSVIKEYNKAFENKNFTPILNLLAKDVKLFGSDSAEIINSITEFNEELKKEWALYDKIKYGDMVNVSIFFDNQATLASVIYGISCSFTRNDNTQTYFFRVARTLKKEDGKWVIVSGIVGIATTGQSSTELLEQKAKVE